MKNILCTVFSLMLLWSCKKDNIPASIFSASESESMRVQDKYLSVVKAYLKDSLSKEDFGNLDFEKAIKTNFDSGKIYILRIQFNNPGNEFVLIKTDSAGNCSKGMILNIKYSKELAGLNLSVTPHSFNGNIKNSSLNRKTKNNFKISDGYIETKKINNFIVPANSFLDCIVDTNIDPAGGITFSDWYNLLDFYTIGDLGINYQNANTSYGYYGPVNPGDYGQTGGYIPIEAPKEIAYEDAESLPSISIESYLKCFNNIADAGATCSVEIFTDLPVNGEPNTFFNWQDGSPGHSFLQIKKSNGTQSVQQNIGFYPNQGWKTLFYTPVTGKFADNSGHKFNASLKMNLSTAQLSSVMQKMEDLSGKDYDLDNYNCTDFALEVFNTVRPGNELKIPMYVIPGNTGSMQSKTPQGLYQQLLSMLEAGVSEGDSITLPGVAGWVGASKGPCN